MSLQCAPSLWCRSMENLEKFLECADVDDSASFTDDSFVAHVYKAKNLRGPGPHPRPHPRLLPQVSQSVNRVNIEQSTYLPTYVLCWFVLVFVVLWQILSKASDVARSFWKQG